MALWKARALTPEQKVQIADDELEANTAGEEEALAKNLQATDEELEAKTQAVDEESEAKGLLRTEESGSFLGVEDVNMPHVYSSILSLPVGTFSTIFSSDLYFQTCKFTQKLVVPYFFRLASSWSCSEGVKSIEG